MLQKMRRNLSYQDIQSFSIHEILSDDKFSFLINKYLPIDYYYNDFPLEYYLRESHNKNSSNSLQPINEMTLKEIRAGADAARLRRSRDSRITCHFQGVTSSQGLLKFMVTSQYTPGLKYMVHIKLKEAKDIKYFKEFNKRDIIRLLLSGDLQVNCTCLRKYTKVKLLDGTYPTVKEMMDRFNSGEKLWVYSVDSDGNFKPGEVERVFISGKSKKFVRVTLDNGKVVETTPDHPFMKRDGSYCKAENLKVGDSLMSLYFRYTDNGYELIKFNKWPDGYHSVYKEVAKSVFSEQEVQEVLNRSGEEHVAIHHIDYNKLNNSPTNLRLMGIKEHIKFHADFINDRKKNDKEFMRKSLEGSRRHIRKLNANPTENMKMAREKFIQKGREVCKTEEWKKNQAIVMRNVVNKYWEGLSKEERAVRQKKILEDNPSILEKQSKIRKEYWGKFTKEEIAIRNKKSIKAMTEAWVHKIKNMSQEERDSLYKRRTSTVYKKIINKMIENNEEITEENFLSHFSKEKIRLCKGRYYGRYFNSLKEVMDYLGEPYSTYNHKVAKIEFINNEFDEDVYDITVKDYHNFYVDAGVIVHNCPDFRYRMKFQAWKMGYGLYKEVRYPKIANPKLIGSVCKHCLAVFRVLHFNTAQIAKAYTNSKFFKKKYKED